MWPYYLIIALICADFLAEHILRKKNIISDNPSSLWIKFLNIIFKYRIITIITLVFFSTFKSLSVGTDSGSYNRYYNDLVHDKSKRFVCPFYNRFEIGFTFLNSILASLGLNIHSLFFASSIAISISLVLFVNKCSPNKIVSLILFIALGTFAQSLNTIRQILAIAIVLIAFMQLIDKKWVKASILIILASTFHISALVAIVIVPIRFIKPRLCTVCIMFVLTIICSFALPNILKLLGELKIFDYYAKYFVDDTKYINPSNLLNTLYSIALIAIFVIMYIGKYKFLRFDDKNKTLYDFFLMIFMFVPLLRIAGFIISCPQLLNRVSMYFFLSLLVLIPLFIKGLQHNHKLYTLANITVYIIAALYMYYLYAIKLSCGVVPYVFCF